MPITRVNTARAGTAAGSVPSLTTGTFVATSSNSIVVIIRTGTDSISNVQDTAGNNYVLKTSDTGITPHMYLYVAENITGHATNAVTVTYPASVTYTWVRAIEYAGVATSLATDTTDHNSGSSATDCISNAIATSGSGDVVVVGVGGSSFTTYTAGTDFTLICGTEGPDDITTFGGTEEYITTTQLATYVAHMNQADAANYALVLTALKPIGGAPAKFWIFGPR